MNHLANELTAAALAFLALPLGLAAEPPEGTFPQAALVQPATPVTQPELREGSPLQDYLLYASLNSPALRAAHDRWLAAMEMIPQARALSDPKFSYTYYIQEVETRVGPQRQSFSLSQMFPWFGKLKLRGDAAAKAAEAAWLDLQSQRLQLLYKVSMLYQDYCYLKHASDVTQENFELLKSLEAVARERYRTGQALTALMQAQVELGKLEDRLRSLDGLRPALSAKLNAALNRESTEVLPWPAPPAADLPVLDSQTIRADVRGNNPELARLGSLAEKEGIAAELARRDGYPDLTVGVTVIDTGGARMPNTDESGKDPVMATVAINLPIWRDKYQAAQREALFRESALREQREEKGNDLQADAALALYYYEDATRKVKLYRDTLLPKAKQSFEVAQQAFQAGKADFLSVIDAQRILLEFRLEVAKATADQGKRFAELQMLTGAGALAEQPQK